MYQLTKTTVIAQFPTKEQAVAEAYSQGFVVSAGMPDFPGQPFKGSPGLKNGIEIIDSEKNHNYKNLLKDLVTACDDYEDQVGFNPDNEGNDDHMVSLMEAIRKAREALK